MFTITPPFTHVEIPRPREATELNNEAMSIEQAARHPLPNRTEFINFSQRDLINDDSSFCRILLATDLQCHVFPFEKLLLNDRLCL